MKVEMVYYKDDPVKYEKTLSEIMKSYTNSSFLFPERLHGCF